MNTPLYETSLFAIFLPYLLPSANNLPCNNAGNWFL